MSRQDFEQAETVNSDAPLKWLEPGQIGFWTSWGPRQPCDICGRRTSTRYGRKPAYGDGPKEWRKESRPVHKCCADVFEEAFPV